MPVASTIEPQIIEAIKESENGISAAELMERVGCSRQMVYKTLAKPTVTVRSIGRSPTGADLFVWDDGEGTVNGVAQEVTVTELPRLGATFRVASMEQVHDDRIKVILRNAEDGKEITFTR